MSSAIKTEAEKRFPTILASAISAGTLMAVVCAASSPLWAGRVLGRDAVLGTVLICLATI